MPAILKKIHPAVSEIQMLMDWLTDGRKVMTIGHLTFRVVDLKHSIQENSFRGLQLWSSYTSLQTQEAYQPEISAVKLAFNKMTFRPKN